MKELDKNTIGGRLRALRKKHRLSMDGFGMKILTSGRTVWSWENGVRQLPADMIVVICKTFRVSADWLLCLEEDINVIHTDPIAGKS